MRAARLQHAVSLVCGLEPGAWPWGHSTYSKNRDRLIAHKVVRELFERVLAQARAKHFLSAEHSQSMGRSFGLGPRTRASCPRTGHRRRAGQLRQSGGRLQGAATYQRHHQTRPIRTRNCYGSPNKKAPFRATWVVRLPRTAMAWWSTLASAKPAAPPSARRPSSLIVRNYLPAGTEARLGPFADWTEEPDFDYERARARMLGYDMKALLDDAGTDLVASTLLEQGSTIRRPVLPPR